MTVNEQFGQQIVVIQREAFCDGITALVTQERAQKLDLLIHLAGNIKQSLVLYGPQGIGKTTLLNVFQARTAGIWPIVFLSTQEQLSFEKIQEQLFKALMQFGLSDVSQSLNQMLQGLEKIDRRVILLCDNAGAMFPGLMTMLVQYAMTFPSLKVVFVLREDELATKSSTEKIVDECHFIKLPPLSEAQSASYLQHLLERLPEYQEKNYTLDAPLIEQIYNKTQGIPGKMVELLPRLLKARAVKNKRWVYMLVGAGLFIVGLGAMRWYSPLFFIQPASDEIHKGSTPKETPSPIAEQKPHPPTESSNPSEMPVATQQATPAQSQPENEVQPLQSATAKQNTSANAVQEVTIPTSTATPLSKVANSNGISNTTAGATTIPTATPVTAPEPEESPLVVTDKPEPLRVNKTAIGERYTLQIMSFMQQDLAADYINEYGYLGPELQIITVKKSDGREKYVLIYGDFETKAQAEAAKKQLPPKFRGAWVRKI